MNLIASTPDGIAQLPRELKVKWRSIIRIGYKFGQNAFFHGGFVNGCQTMRDAMLAEREFKFCKSRVKEVSWSFKGVVLPED